jgi:RiboL-PSP-HEPN
LGKSIKDSHPFDFLSHVSFKLKNCSNPYASSLDFTEAFPYSVNLTIFGLDTSVTVKKGDRTLWETFLDDLLKRRHDIAHGSNMMNGISATEIMTAKAKVVVLQYAFAILLCQRAA